MNQYKVNAFDSHSQWTATANAQMNALDPVPHRLFLTKQDENIYPYITYRSLFAVQRSSKYRQPQTYKLWIEDKCILSGYAQHLVGSKLVTCPRYSSKEALWHQGRAAEMVQAGPGSRILTEYVCVCVCVLFFWGFLGGGVNKRGRYGMGHIGLVFLVGGSPRICFETNNKMVHSEGIL